MGMSSSTGAPNLGHLTPLVLSLLYDKVLHSLKYCEEIYLCITIHIHTMYKYYALDVSINFDYVCISRILHIYARTPE